MKKTISVMIKMMMFLLCLQLLTACSSNENVTDVAIIAEWSDLNTPPSEEYVISCLEKIESIDEIAVVTEGNDPNGNLNKQGYYISQVFFSSKWLEKAEIYGEDLINKGTDAGGSIEIYRTEKDAQTRDEYLKGFDGNMFFDSGSHTYIGPVVVRTSKELSERQQNELTKEIINILTNGRIKYNESVQNENKDNEKQPTITNEPSSPEGVPTEPLEKENISQIVLPQNGSKLGKDFDYKSEETACYVNVDNTSNIPVIKKWGKATVTDGVAEYLDYLQSLGFAVTITETKNREPYAGFYLYETEFKVVGSEISWTMYLSIQDEDYVEYEFRIEF